MATESNSFSQSNIHPSCSCCSCSQAQGPALRLRIALCVVVAGLIAADVAMYVTYWQISGAEHERIVSLRAASLAINNILNIGMDTM